MHAIFCGVMTLVSMTILAGCETQEDWGGTIFVHEAVGENTSRVTIRSPQYARVESVTDTHYVEVIWDGEVLFEGWLPSTARRQVRFTGENIRLIQIDTVEGEHVLEIRCEGKSCVKTVNVRRRAYHELLIGVDPDGQPTINLSLWG